MDNMLGWKATTIYKLGGNFLGSPREEARLKDVRLLAEEDIKKAVFPIIVISAYRREKPGITDVLLNYRGIINGTDPRIIKQAIKRYGVDIRKIAMNEELAALEQICNQDSDESSVQAHQYYSEETGTRLFRKILEKPHGDLVNDLKLNREENKHLIARITDEISELVSTAKILVKGEANPAFTDLLVSGGERLASFILQAYMESHKKALEFPLSVQAFTGKEIGMFTDANYGNASINWGVASASISQQIKAIMGQHVIPVITGFDGVHQSQQGELFRTTLGRSGSDLTASFIAYSLVTNGIPVEAVNLLKTTPGIMTADPVIVPTAVTLPYVDYGCAKEAGNIMHRSCEPLEKANIALYVFDPKVPDKKTRVSNDQLQHGLYLATDPVGGKYLVVSGIENAPGGLVNFLAYFAKSGLNVRRPHHGGDITELFVDSSPKLPKILSKLKADGYQITAEVPANQFMLVGKPSREEIRGINAWLDQQFDNDAISYSGYHVFDRSAVFTVSAKVDPNQILRDAHERFILPTVQNM